MKHRMASRFLASLLNRPHMIEPAAGAAVLAALAPGARLDGYDGEAANDAREQREYQVINGTAVIPIIGEMVHRGSSLRPVSGLCSYQAIDDAVADAFNTNSVTHVVYEYDTPGGMADGCLDLADKLRGYRGRKPTTAVVNVRATSAGYALAAQADRVVITPSGFVGSIGVVAYHFDISKALSEDGIVVTALFAGARKIDGSPYLPLSDEARAEAMARIEEQYTRFCEVVAAGRAHAGLTVEAVRATEAAILMGEAAVKAGLADEVSTLEKVITMSNIENRAPVPGARLAGPGTGDAMKTEEPGDGFKPCEGCTDEAGCKAAGACAKDSEKAKDTGANDDAKAADPATIATMCHTAGVSELTAKLLGGQQTMGSLKAAIADAKEVLTAGTQYGQPDLARRLIGEGVSAATAKAILHDTAARIDMRTQTDTTRSAGQTGKPGGAALDASAIYASFNGKMKG